MTLRHYWYALSLSTLAVRLTHCPALPCMYLGMAFRAQIIVSTCCALVAVVKVVFCSIPSL